MDNEDKKLISLQNQKREMPSASLSAAQNPIQDFEYDNEIQVYFNRKYLKINTFTKEVIAALSPKGRISGFIDDILLEVGAVSAKYFLDGTVPESKKRNYSMAQDTLIVTDKLGNVICIAHYRKQSLRQITAFFDDSVSEIYFREMNFFSRFLDKTPKIKSYETKNLDEQTLERVEYSQSGSVEKYISNKNSSPQYEIIFDTDTLALGMADKSALIPKTFITYDPVTSQRAQVLNYTYARPTSLVEYNPKTGMQIRLLKMQGLQNTVYKYSFFDDNTGVLNKSGSL